MCPFRSEPGNRLSGRGIGSSPAVALKAMHADRPIRILIVDDDRVDRGLYKQCLQQSPVWKFECAEADSAIAGMEMANAWPPDCALLDFNLPDMDGIEFLSRLKSGPNGLPWAIVMLTAYGCEELAVRAMKAGASDYLPKGRLSAGILAQTVVNAVERFRMQQQIEQQRLALSSDLAADSWQSSTFAICPSSIR